MTDEQKQWLRGNRGLSEKKRHGGREPGSKNKSGDPNLVPPDSSQPDNRVRSRLAKEYGVGTQTIDRDMKFAKQVREIDEKFPGAKEKILAGDLKLNRKDVAQLAELPAKEIKKVLQAPEKAPATNNGPVGAPLASAGGLGRYLGRPAEVPVSGAYTASPSSDRQHPPWTALDKLAARLA